MSLQTHFTRRRFNRILKNSNIKNTKHSNKIVAYSGVVVNGFIVAEQVKKGRNKGTECNQRHEKCSSVTSLTC